GPWLGWDGARRLGEQDMAGLALHRRLSDLNTLVLQDPDADRRCPGGLETEQLGGATRYVDDAALDIRPAVIDAQPQRAAVADIGHLDDARQRQRLMGRRQLVQIVDLAVRSRL